MSIRFIYHLIIWVIFPLGSVILIILAFLISNYYAIAFLIWPIMIGLILNQCKCPNCNYLVGGRRVDFGILSFNLRLPIAPKECINCKHNINLKRQP